MEKSLEGLSARWFWVERTLISDTKKLIREQEEHDKEFKEVNRDLIDSFKTIISSCNKRLVNLNQEIVLKVNGEPYSLAAIIKMTQDIATTLKIANEQIRLCFGLSTTNDHININAKVKAEADVTVNLLDNVKRKRKELNDLRNSD